MVNFAKHVCAVAFAGTVSPYRLDNAGYSYAPHVPGLENKTSTRTTSRTTTGTTTQTSSKTHYINSINYTNIGNNVNAYTQARIVSNLENDVGHSVEISGVKEKGRLGGRGRRHGRKWPLMSCNVRRSPRATVVSLLTINPIARS